MEESWRGERKLNSVYKNLNKADTIQRKEKKIKMYERQKESQKEEIKGRETM